VFCVVLADGCARNKGTRTEERRFLCASCRDVISRTSLLWSLVRTVSSASGAEWVGELVT
jgi:hypothetical protein